MGETLEEIAARVKAERRLRMRSKMRGIAIPSPATKSLSPVSEASPKLLTPIAPPRNYQESQSLVKSTTSAASSSSFASRENLVPGETNIGSSGDSYSSNYGSGDYRSVDYGTSNDVSSTMTKEIPARQQLDSEYKTTTPAQNDAYPDDPSHFNSTSIGNNSNSQYDTHRNHPQHGYKTSTAKFSSARDATKNGRDDVHNNQTNDHRYQQKQNHHHDQYQNHNRGYGQNYEQENGHGYMQQNYSEQVYDQSYGNQHNYDRQDSNPHGHDQSYKRGYSGQEYGPPNSSSSKAAAGSDYRYEDSPSKAQNDPCNDPRNPRSPAPSSTSRRGYETNPPRQSLQQQQEIYNDLRGRTALPSQTNRGYDVNAPRGASSSQQSYSQSQREDPRFERQQQQQQQQLRQNYSDNPQDFSIPSSPGVKHSAKSKAMTRGYGVEPLKTRGYQTESVPKRGYQLDPLTGRKQQQQQSSLGDSSKRPLERKDSNGGGTYGYYRGHQEGLGSYGNQGRGQDDAGSGSSKRPKMDNKISPRASIDFSHLSESDASNKFGKGGKNSQRHRRSNTEKSRKSLSPPNMGKGRGRGMGMNKPAWMSEEQYMQQQRQQTRQSGPIGISRGNLFEEGSPVAHGRGRGRGMLKPAWMPEEQFLEQQKAREESNAPIQMVQSALSASSDGHCIAASPPPTKQEKESQSQSIYGPAGAMNNANGSHLHKHSSISGSKKRVGRYKRKGSTGRALGGESRVERGDGASERIEGRGRGRGIGTNKPAWMTEEQYLQQSQKNSVDPKLNGDSPSGVHFGGGNGSLGRGRGRGRTLPAWMTK